MLIWGVPASRCRMLLTPMLLMMMVPGGCGTTEPDPGPVGVTQEIASDRAGRISELSYSLTLRIPEDPAEPVTGTASVRFNLKDPERGLAFDFRAPADNLQEVRQNHQIRQFPFRGDRIEIPAEALTEGANAFDFAFRSSNLALNRRPDYMYSLFVPDRAASAFPCFDQPDLKARFRLVLNIPADWVPLSNGGVAAEVEIAGRKIVSFLETDLLSTYQFAFAAGEFSSVELAIGERRVRLFHRESDQARLDRNLGAIFEWHRRSLQAMEEYTGIPQPYQKFDVLLVPGLQFGGMEHPGAVYYRDSTLLLDESATPQDELNRAHLIAHETAHMWFGNLVTMRWFDDVWMKEVFANFMAARIVNPAFPNQNHAAAFFLAHHPPAHDVDRSRGTHAIRQRLHNLREASDLYGPIIYQKAPILMRQLERTLGETAFRQGVVQYLKEFSHANADWNDLIRILDPLTEEDLGGWSRAWVETAGRPEIAIDLDGTGGLLIRSRDPDEEGRIWPQRLSVTFLGPGGVISREVDLSGSEVRVEMPPGEFPLVVANGDGMAYGRIALSKELLEGLVDRLGEVTDSVARASACVTLLEAVLAGELPAGRVLSALTRQIGSEREPRLLQYQMDLAGSLYWRLLPPKERLEASPDLESVLLARVRSQDEPGIRLSALRSLASIATSPEVLGLIEGWWSGSQPLDGVELGEASVSRLAHELALRAPDGGGRILDAQLEKITDPERKERFRFLMGAVSPDVQVRSDFLKACFDPSLRPKETWVLDGLTLVHHPLRTAVTEELLLPSLAPLAEVHRTGSIFYSKRWLDAVLWGYRSPSARRALEDFLAAETTLSPRLRQKVLQSADYLVRSTPARQ